MERRCSLILADFLPIAAIATTPSAAKVLLPVCLSIGADLWVSESLGEFKGTQVYSGSLREHLTNIWSQYRGFIFGLATGAVVRLIAPLLQDKSVDPAVIVVDENGKFVISLCGGHQGGADRLARATRATAGETALRRSPFRGNFTGGGEATGDAAAGDGLG